MSGFACSRKRASKVDFGGQAPRWLCPLSDSSHRLFRSRPVLGGMERGDLLLEVSQAATEFDMDMGSTYRRGMPTVLSIMWSEKRTIMPIIWLS